MLKYVIALLLAYDKDAIWPVFISIHTVHYADLCFLTIFWTGRKRRVHMGNYKPQAASLFFYSGALLTLGH